MRRFFFLPTSALLVLTAAASAQPTRDVHRIQIQERAGQCLYHIADQERQDVFVITPGGRLVLEPVGDVQASAVITQSDQGVPATSGTNATMLSEETPRTLSVRDVVGRDSEHHVRIQCCVEGGGRLCRRWLDAEAASLPTDEQDREDGEAPPVERMGSRTTGGPKMEVDE